ncbi:MAG: SCO family protein [Rubripirellula sp.]
MIFSLQLTFAGCKEAAEEMEISAQKVDADRIALEAFNRERVNSFSTEEYEDADGARVSDRFPDIGLIDHRGRSLQFYSDLVEDRCVCLIYFYTRCVGSCPVTTQVVKKLRKDLAEEFSNNEFLFVSLTLEPEVDSPEELRTYMKIHGIEDDEKLPDWVYATGDFAELDNLRRTLGIYDLDPVIDADKTEHAAILTFGNDRLDRWAALPVDMNYEQLKQAMIRIMGSSPRQRYASAAQYREDRLEEFRLAEERLLQQQ